MLAPQFWPCFVLPLLIGEISIRLEIKSNAASGNKSMPLRCMYLEERHHLLSINARQLRDLDKNIGEAGALVKMSIPAVACARTEAIPENYRMASASESCRAGGRTSLCPRRDA